MIELDPAGYPETVNSFVFLAREGFFDGQVFYRIIADFQLFSGDPMADGTGGPGYRLPDELPPDDFVYTPGVVAMDNVGKGTTGSRFFIVLSDDAQVLNPQFNGLGNVISGQETLDRIQAVDTAATTRLCGGQPPARDCLHRDCDHRCNRFLTVTPAIIGVQETHGR